jgi:hypothetical protein
MFRARDGLAGRRDPERFRGRVEGERLGSGKSADHRFAPQLALHRVILFVPNG